ncbi:BCS1-mitochondrial of the AAA family of ATPase [Fusarium pseudocircinatum]|uniref:BCS1-mitochondrial of the AAA family of ATPase n=1 Tax=Fusarium pseudocircinatum TaxID=56676 RepID=A0A8H5PF44_9HYPO|nr:BCS1-mitochondrial of the AAA family of ATPase [Fusarium pseudocircinatum]
MPFYEVHHSYPLTQHQRQNLATAITRLHCEAFKTPSFLVHVRFLAEDNINNTYFVAGKSHSLTSNRISGNVRTSAARSKADFDDLGAKIEAAWYETLQVSPPPEKLTWSKEDEKTRLIMVKFVPLVTIREGGMAAPQAGEEEAWLKEQLPHIEAPPPPERRRSSYTTLKSIVDGKNLSPHHNVRKCVVTVDADPKKFEAAIQALKQHQAKPKIAPSADLEPQDSHEIAATCILSWWNQTAWFFTTGAWAQGEMDGYCTWYAPNGSWFGVNIHCPVQFLGTGTAPYYEVAWSEGGKETFFKPVDEPFMSFDFPRSLGYDIQIKPQSGHSSIIVDGIGIMRDVVSRWSELDITQIGSLIAIAGTVPTAWRFLHRIWYEVYGTIRRFFLASVTIPGGDPLNRSVVKWILANRERHYRSFHGRTDIGQNGDRAAALKKTKHSIQYSPHWNTRWLFYEGNLFLVTRRIDDFSSSLSDPSYDGIGGEEITVSCFGWSAEPIKTFIESCREYSDRQTQFFVIIYARDRYGLSWKPKARKPIRHLETVHFDNETKQELLGDIRNYLDPKTQKRYQSRSMPYRRGYLFYGPPGTGKSSLSVAIAGEFGLDLYEVKIPSVATDADLEQMFQEIPPRCVVLLEDIDAVWTDRSNSDNGQEGSSAPNCSLSGLLNVLDGVGSVEGRIIIMTTNHPEQLDSALVRPGRVDMKVLLGNISRNSAEEMFIRMFSPDLGCTSHLDMDEIKKLAEEFGKEIPDDTFTPSLLQGFFQLHLESPREAASSIGAWVKRELERSSEKEFELINDRWLRQRRVDRIAPLIPFWDMIGIRRQGRRLEQRDCRERCGHLKTDWGRFTRSTVQQNALVAVQQNVLEGCSNGVPEAQTWVQNEEADDRRHSKLHQARDPIKKKHDRVYDYHPQPAMGYSKKYGYSNYGYYNGGKKSRKHGRHYASAAGDLAGAWADYSGGGHHGGGHSDGGGGGGGADGGGGGGCS